MNQKLVHVEFSARLSKHDPDHVEGVFELVADALMACTGVVDQDLAMDLNDCSLTFSMYFVDPESMEGIVKRAVAIARSSLHAAGERTPADVWELDYDLEMNRVDDREAVSA